MKHTPDPARAGSPQQALRSIGALIASDQASRAYSGAQALGPAPAGADTGPGDDLAIDALSRGMAETAWALAESGWSGLSCEELLREAVDAEDMDAIEFLATKAAPRDLWRAACGSPRFDGAFGRAASLSASLASDKEQALWEEAAPGLLARWDARAANESYAAACARAGAPAWSGACAGPAGSADPGPPALEPPDWGPPSGGPRESLLWGPEHFERWRTLMESEPGRAWSLGMFDEMQASHQAISALLPRLRSAAARGSEPECAALAQECSRAGAGRWLASALCSWGTWDPAGPGHGARAILMRAAAVDRFNAGSLAAAMAHAPRLPGASLALAWLDRLGAVDDDAASILAARARDLAQDAKWSSALAASPSAPFHAQARLRLLAREAALRARGS